ncbi:MAG: hypothetical protein LBM65_04780 [Oscillospiraceae bacterium]|jgi:CobQ-like glutamine amidotransferase family enzyme|nr:hypothetical protein [Oscillospiraceae bacterium]
MIKILHLYNNLLNLYGEYANMVLLKKHLADQNIKVEVITADSAADVRLEDFQFIYIGAGTERKQKLALADLQTRRDDIVHCIESGTNMLLTGNSFEMLGRVIVDADGVEHSGLCCFDFSVTEQSQKRLTGDVTADCAMIPATLVGFVNKCSTIIFGQDSAEPDAKPQAAAIPASAIKSFCTVKRGLGNDNVAPDEGIRYKNLCGTHLTGPLLVKNPLLLDWLVKKLAESSDTKGFVFTPHDYPNENDAYAVTLQKLG